eukprot:Seg642.2 transcript_id=Seg642.2/GoldUCD/mRNA.D3Y31 product="Glutathione S-transferase 1" protein_id=Seg642.2/GoldUCD/D3Y31
MPRYVLHYFDMAGRAEPIRILFHQAGVEFEDRRIKREDWPELKKNDKLFPFGQMPILEVDGVVLAQSDAISKYLATEFGLYGKTSLDRAKSDMLVDGIHDIMVNLVAVFKESDETLKAAKKKAFFEEHLPKGLKLYEEKFVPRDGFFLGDDVTRCDIAFMSFLDRCEEVQKGNMDSFPLCKALCERVRECPNIKKFFDAKKA